MQEAEFKKITIPGESGLRSCETTTFSMEKAGYVVCAYYSSYGGKCKIEGSRSRLAWAKSEIPYQK
jgi:hypothetical protein